MCYSAQVQADYRKYVRMFGAEVSVGEFYDLFYRRGLEGKLKIPKAMEASFSHPGTEDERSIKALIDDYHAKQAAKFEEELFRQRNRLADAERSLQGKTTKKALDDQRIAADKIRHLTMRHADLQRTDALERDSRIFPGYYAPVLIWEDGRRVVKPMRYGCRPAGKPAFYDVKYPGTYNARRDNLQGFWKQQFGRTHGLIVVDAFFENVNRHRVEGRELAPGEEPENVVLEFRPRPQQSMLVACLWSRWTGPGEPALLSFAAITDDPPPEVAAAGHDRCIVPVRQQHVDAWLNASPGQEGELLAILDDHERPYYDHRMAA